MLVVWPPATSPGSSPVSPGPPAPWVAAPRSSRSGAAWQRPRRPGRPRWTTAAAAWPWPTGHCAPHAACATGRPEGLDGVTRKDEEIREICGCFRYGSVLWICGGDRDTYHPYPLIYCIILYTILYSILYYTILHN